MSLFCLSVDHLLIATDRCIPLIPFCIEAHCFRVHQAVAWSLKLEARRFLEPSINAKLKFLRLDSSWNLVQTEHFRQSTCSQETTSYLSHDTVCNSLHWSTSWVQNTSLRWLFWATRTLTRPLTSARARTASHIYALTKCLLTRCNDRSHANNDRISSVVRP